MLTTDGRMRRRQNLIEDVEWMLLGGESLTGAARRQASVPGAIGTSPTSLERILLKAGRPDLLARLRANEPRSMRRAA